MTLNLIFGFLLSKGNWPQLYTVYAITWNTVGLQKTNSSSKSLFFPIVFMARMLRAWVINPSGKNLVRNLQYGPWTRLVRGIYCGFFLFLCFLFFFYVVFRCGVALDVWMLPLGNEIFDYELDQPLLFVNSQHFHCWKENMDTLKELINKKPGKVTEAFFPFYFILSSFYSYFLSSF